MKTELRALLAKQDVEAIVALARKSQSTLSKLYALTYDNDPQIANRAVEMLGVAAGAVSDSKPEFVRGQLRRMLWLLNDESGGIGWHAPEAIGEIIRARPALYSEFVPLLLSLLDMAPEDAAHLGRGVLKAIRRVADVADLSMHADQAPLVRRYLGDRDPTVRALAAEILEYFEPDSK